MEFLILVVLFLIALGCEKEPQEENVYVARRPARRVARGYAHAKKRVSRSAS